MDIIAASNIGMTNAYKNRKRTPKRRKVEKNKLYVLAEIKYIVDGELGNDNIVITICNSKVLIEIAQEYYEARQLKNNHKWENLDIKNLKIKDAIEILTTRKYAKIQEIDEDMIGMKIRKNRLVELIIIKNLQKGV